MIVSGNITSHRRLTLDDPEDGECLVLLTLRRNTASPEWPVQIRMPVDLYKRGWLSHGVYVQCSDADCTVPIMGDTHTFKRAA